MSRENDAARKRESRAKESTVVIPACADRERRERLEKDDEAWLLFYFGEDCELDDPFWYEFTEQQQEIIKAVAHALEFGGDQAIAASRGEGKSTIVERLLLKYHLQGKVDFSVIFQATGALAEGSLDSIKNTLERNVLLLADYPEVCIPVIEVSDAPQKAGSIKVSGNRHDNGKPYERVHAKFTWSGQEVIFPNVPGSPSAKSIMATRGLEGAVRGLRKRGKRPKINIIDDPDTEDTAVSEIQAAKLEKRIEGALGGSGGQRRRAGRVMITTVQSRISVSFKYTDPKQKRTFKGKRFKFLTEPFKNMELVEQYLEMYEEDLLPEREDPFARRSHAFYLQNQEAIERGAAVSNKNRFDPTVLADGTQLEVSAFQFYLNEIVRLGKEYVLTEYDNDPPEVEELTEAGLESRKVQVKVNNTPRLFVPQGCILLTQGMDIKKVAIHYVVRAWMSDGTGFTIDYGIHETRGTVYGSDLGVDVAVRRAILERIEQTRETKYVSAVDNDRTFDVDLTVVDARWRTQAVLKACLEAGAGVMPIMGFGKSAGCAGPSFNDAQRSTTDKKPGDGWFLSRKGSQWLIGADTDRWKRWEHDRWKIPTGESGSMSLFGYESEIPDRLSPDQRDHHSYSKHITNEQEREMPYKGGVKRVWHIKNSNVHYLDASYYSDVAANIRGVKLDTEASMVASPAKIEQFDGRPKKSRSLFEMAQEARRRR